jgi:hypothetical protein
MWYHHFRGDDTTKYIRQESPSLGVEVYVGVPMDEAEVTSSPSRRKTFDIASVSFRHSTNCCLVYRWDEVIINQNLKQSNGHLSRILQLKKNRYFLQYNLCIFSEFTDEYNSDVSMQYKCICKALFISDAVCVRVWSGSDWKVATRFKAQ